MSEETIIKKIFELEDQISGLSDNISKRFKENTEASKKVITILKRLNQERIFTAKMKQSLKIV